MQLLKLDVNIILYKKPIGFDNMNIYSFLISTFSVTVTIANAFHPSSSFDGAKNSLPHYRAQPLFGRSLLKMTKENNVWL